MIIHVNVYGINLAYDRPWLQQFYNDADISVCDGVGPILGARLLGSHIPKRITYADWIWELAEFAEPLGYTFFLLGGKPGVADQAGLALKKRFPNLNIVGTHHGYFDKRQGSTENQAVIKKINALKPNLLLVGFGMPRQEKWLLENWANIDANVGLGPGALFDYLSGDVQRAPKWMTDNSLEWLGRFLVEPRRLWRRYLVGNPLFLSRVLLQRLGLIQLGS